MARSIKISDEEMELVRREAQASSRSISGQVTHWLRIGRAIERSPNFSHVRIREAMEARRSPDTFGAEEQQAYLEELLAAASAPTPEQEAFFRARREDGLGAGLDEDGNIVRQSPVARM